MGGVGAVVAAPSPELDSPLSMGLDASPSGAIPESELRNGIRKISETQYQISRSLMSKILENQANLTSGVKVAPQRTGGQITGVKLFRLSPNNVLNMVGLQNGDELRTINGYNMGDPKSALEAYAKLQTADRLTLSVMRGGSPMNFEYRVQ